MPTPKSDIRLRAMLTGLVLVLAISLLSPWAVLMVKGSQLTSNAIPIVAVVFFFLLTACALPLLRALGPSWVFTRSELLAVYIMMIVGSVVVTTGFTGSFLSVISGLMYYATPENEWAVLFGPHIHPWLAPENPDAIRLFFEGLPKGMPIPWAAWSKPLVAWICFILVFYWVTLCLGVLLRGQWVANERLVFPLTRLPLDMLQDPDEGRRLGRFFASRLLWIGFLIPFLLHSWNSLNFYHEAFHKIAINGNLVLLEGLVNMPVRLNLPVLGLAYLMPLNVSFSIWFFFVLYTIEKLIFARIGLQIGAGDIWTSAGATTPIAHQQAGGLLILSLFVLWTARSHLRQLWQLARRGERSSHELLAPRTAFAGLFIGFGFLVSWLSVTGLDFYIAILLVLGALIVFIGLTRIVCEAGLPGCQMPMAPQAFIARGFGPELLGMRNLTGMGFSTVWIGETAANMMNAVMHSLKLNSSNGRSTGRLVWCIFSAIAVGLAGSIWITMDMAYTHGGINLNSWYYSGAPRWPFRYMASIANQPEPSFAPRFWFTLSGSSMMALLLFLRQRFIWWPLHPIGFPIASTYTIVYYGWLVIFMAWLAKTCVLRYGGIRLYRELTPFFLGLVLGEFFTASLWVFIDGYFDVQGNMIFNF